MSRFYTRAELDNSPSRRSGLDAKKETQLRWAACDLIKEAGMRLKVYAHAPPRGKKTCPGRGLTPPRAHVCAARA
jgi:hypothetical protein